MFERFFIIINVYSYRYIILSYIILYITQVPSHTYKTVIIAVISRADGSVNIVFGAHDRFRAPTVRRVGTVYSCVILRYRYYVVTYDCCKVLNRDTARAVTADGGEKKSRKNSRSSKTRGKKITDSCSSTYRTNPCVKRTTKKSSEMCSV